MQAQLTAGFARTDVTPELGTLLMGYPTPDRKAEAIRDCLQANALVLRQGDTAAVLLSLTVCIVDDAEVEAIRRGVAERIDVPAEHVTVCATQTHSAPCTQDVWGWCNKDRAYIERMVDGSVEAAVNAAREVHPVRLGIGTDRSEVGINRRAILEDHSVALGVNGYHLGTRRGGGSTATTLPSILMPSFLFWFFHLHNAVPRVRLCSSVASKESQISPRHRSSSYRFPPPRW